MPHLCMPLRYRIVRQPQAPCRRHGPLTANYPARHGAPQPHARQFLQGTAARYAAATADVDAVALIGAVVGHVAHVRVAPAGAVAVRVALAPVAACSVMPLSAYSAVLLPTAPLWMLAAFRFTSHLTLLMQDASDYPACYFLCLFNHHHLPYLARLAAMSAFHLSAASLSFCCRSK